MLAKLVRTNITLLQKCLNSKKSAVYLSAIDGFIRISNMFGPALNKHLPIILPIILKRAELAKGHHLKKLKDCLLENGGQDAKRLLRMYPTFK